MLDLSAFQNDPIMHSLRAAEPVFWRNPHTAPFAEALADVGLSAADVHDAAARLQRFAAYFLAAFPETAATQGLIESPLLVSKTWHQHYHLPAHRVLIKADNQLPISGAIKARGGIYEVLLHAETLALQHGLLRDTDDDYSKLHSDAARALFGQYSVAVGSTGNLGLSIGMMAAKLGFRAVVHMSADARQWKKDKLREHGAIVVEYAGDYGMAVAAGRQAAEQDPYAYFVDDESSRHLFLGYAVAGLRLKAQLDALQITVDAHHPLIVYLPCGVGGGPGGVAFGLKLALGDAVQCVFAEPTHSPCMLLGVYTGLHDAISVQDIGLDNITIADGLAVGRASGFVGRAMQRSLSAFYTLTDSQLAATWRAVYEQEGLYLEPSAAAGFAGLPYFADTPHATHLVWVTGGGLQPQAAIQEYLATCHVE